MKTSPLDDPIWIDQPAALKTMIADLSQQPLVAVDTESNSLYAYQEQVCLIQFSTPQRDYLVDPLALQDLSPLSPLFSNPDIEKIFHAAEYDLICLKRDFNFTFQNLFDTMIAGRILGKDSFGLASMLQAVFDIKVDKRYQKANWGKRPLPQEYTDYARLDTHYLIPLRNLMKKELVESGRWPLAQEDFVRQCHVEIPVTENGLNLCWRIAGREKLSDRQMAVLQSLCVYRDKQAQTRNVPPFKIISNRSLLQIALAGPTNEQSLAEVDGLSYRNVQRHKNWLVEAVRVGSRHVPVTRAAYSRRDNDMVDRLKQLHNWRKITAQKMGVPSDVVLPRDIMQEIASQNPSNPEELRKVMETIPWRFEQFGKDLMQELQLNEERIC